MAVTITHNGTVYSGRSAKSVARRVWGRRVEVRCLADPHNIWGGTVQALITRTDWRGTHVLAQVVVGVDDGAAS